MGSDRPQTSRRRVTVAEASEILGVTVEAVRGRIKRGTLKHERDSGTVYVLLPTDQAATGRQPDGDQTADQAPPAERDELADELRDRIRYLERQVEEEREARRRADTLLAQLMQRIPELEAPSEPTGAPHSAAGPPSSPSVVRPPERETVTEEPFTEERPPRRRSWWQRVAEVTQGFRRS